MQLTPSQTFMVLGAVMAMAVVAAAGQFLTGIPAWLTGTVLAALATVISRRFTA